MLEKSRHACWRDRSLKAKYKHPKKTAANILKRYYSRRLQSGPLLPTYRCHCDAYHRSGYWTGSRYWCCVCIELSRDVLTEKVIGPILATVTARVRFNHYEPLHSISTWVKQAKCSQVQFKRAQQQFSKRWPLKKKTSSLESASRSGCSDRHANDVCICEYVVKPWSSCSVLRLKQSSSYTPMLYCWTVRKVWRMVPEAMGIDLYDWTSRKLVILEGITWPGSNSIFAASRKQLGQVARLLMCFDNNEWFLLWGKSLKRSRICCDHCIAMGSISCWYGNNLFLRMTCHHKK